MKILEKCHNTNEHPDLGIVDISSSAEQTPLSAGRTYGLS